MKFLSIPKLFDIHTHVQFAAFRDDADLVIKRARDSGVWMVNVGTQKDTAARAVGFTEKYTEGVYAAVGLHPIHTEKSYHDEQELGITNKELGGFESRGEVFDYEYYKKLAENPKVVAIGECGLDYAVFVREQRERQQKRASAETCGEGGLPIEERKAKQHRVFLQQIKLAAEVKKPLMIHCRQAFPDLIQILSSKLQVLSSPPGIIHFFSGVKEDAKELLDLGFSFSFGGVITFSRDYDEVVKYIPMERILLETDAPYVAPIPYRGKRNEPLYVIEVAKKLAELKNLSVEEVSEMTTKNALALFSTGIESL
ncbi:MAG: TatD family hydrolase [Candidatus Sungbacteria bacterium]|nr:TatD family hydrolase [Candidatus Sungbacteria bacterium]